MHLNIEKDSFVKITANSIIIGFTGALGSGCTLFAEGLREFHQYKYYRLSDLIKQEAAQQGKAPTTENLQNIGNQLRQTKAEDYLVRVALFQLEETLKSEKFEGDPKIVIDGIRNTAEVESLRAVSNFFLISMHAEEEDRRKRSINANKFQNEDEFKRADRRDQEENLPYGQQVKKCNYLSDIIIYNDSFINLADRSAYEDYIYSKLYQNYIGMIQQAASNQRRHLRAPTDDEALMTAAYVESKRSRCMKRKVGAIIATKEGEILSTGHNDPPPGEKPCIEDESYQWCARDIILEKMGGGIKMCPACGQEIRIDAACASCGEKLSSFIKNCPVCHEDPHVDYVCTKCGSDVFREFLPGSKPDTGKLLDMCRSLHAEDNAILNLTKTGVSSSMAHTIYTTTFPCNLCANKIATIGIKKVVYAEPYITKEALQTLKKHDIDIDRFEGVKSSAYFKLFT